MFLHALPGSAHTAAKTKALAATVRQGPNFLQSSTVNQPRCQCAITALASQCAIVRFFGCVDGWLAEQPLGHLRIGGSDLG